MAEKPRAPLDAAAIQDAVLGLKPGQHIRVVWRVAEDKVSEASDWYAWDGTVVELRTDPVIAVVDYGPHQPFIEGDTEVRRTLPPAHERGTDRIEVGAITPFKPKRIPLPVSSPAKPAKRMTPAEVFLDAESDVEPVAVRSKKPKHRVEDEEEIEYSSDDEEEPAASRVPTHKVAALQQKLEGLEVALTSREDHTVTLLEKKIAMLEKKLEERRGGGVSDSEEERTDVEDGASCAKALERRKKRTKKYVEANGRFFYACLFGSTSLSPEKVRQDLNKAITDVKLVTQDKANKRNIQEMEFLHEQILDAAVVLADTKLSPTTRYRVCRMAQASIESLVAVMIRMKSCDNQEVARYETKLAADKERIIKKKILVIPYAKYVEAAPLGRPKPQGGRFGQGVQQRTDGQPPRPQPAVANANPGAAPARPAPAQPRN